MERVSVPAGKNESTGEVLKGSLVMLMSVACGLSVANLYYSQPLLADIARDLHALEQNIGMIPMFTQIGYAIGMLVFVPLGDLYQRRTLIVVLLALVSGALVIAGVSQTLPQLVIASTLIGITTIVPQILIPFAAQLARPAVRGRIVGALMSGLLVGILLARTISGFVGSELGWRKMYGFGAATMLVLAVVLGILLPKSTTSFEGSWRELMGSLFRLVRDEPVLREAAIVGGLLFAAFSAFWTTLVFHLEQPPFSYGSKAAGLFGLVGAAGAMGASIFGRLVDRYDPRRLLGISILLTIVSFLIFWTLGTTLIAMIVGVALMDLGVQGGHVSNQTRIYALSENAHGRVNTVYMVTYFIGGAVGSSLGSIAMSKVGWSGVCALGVALLSLAFLLLGVARPERREGVAAGVSEGEAV